MASLQTRIRRTDDEILAAVKRQSASGSRARTELRAARSFVVETLSKIDDIRRRASLTESMVQDVCRNIKSLDYAKRNLTMTITAMRRLAMLVSAVDRLQIAAERREYDEAAHLLGAVQQLAAHFAGLTQVPRVAEVRGRVAALEQALKSAALREFELLGEERPNPALLKRLKDCAALMDALGPTARNELVDTFCKKEIGTYTQIFGTLGETARLDKTVNRYKWLIRRLEARKDVLDLFPKQWRVSQLLCVTFCSVTKTALAEILDERASEIPQHLDALMHAIEATNIFEAELAKRFGGKSIPGTEGSEDDPSVASRPDDGNAFGSIADDSLSAAEIRRRYEQVLYEKKVDAAGQSSSREIAQDRAAAAAVARASFVGAISSVFVPYLYVYVDHVSESLQRKVETLIAAETWNQLSPEQFVLKSANDLTDAVRSEMRDCVARVGRGVVLRDLARVFGQAYNAYAQLLLARVPKNSTGTTSGTPTFGVIDWQIKMSNEDIEVVGLILATAEHCIDMLDQLSRALLARLQPPNLGDEVSFDREQERFRSLAMNCVSALLLGVETRLETALGMLAKNDWTSLDVVGDQSAWSTEAVKILRDIGPLLGGTLASNHFRFVCDKLTRSFSGRLLVAVYRCLGISEAGCQQLRLDMEAVKVALVSMARSGASASSDASLSEWIPSFAADVNNQMSRVEAVLKVVSSPIDAMVDTFLELLPDASPSDLQRIAEVKGLRRHQLTTALDAYSSRTGKRRTANERVLVGSDSPTRSLQSAPDSGIFGQLRTSMARPSSVPGDVGTMFRLPSSSAVHARAGASSAAENMRETMGQALKSMKGFRFMHKRGSSRGSG